MDMEKILSQLVRIGTVMSTDSEKRMARVKFEDTGHTSGWLHVLASRPYIPGYAGAERTEFEAGGSGDPAFASHKHDLTIRPWMPMVNAAVLTLYLPMEDADGFILGEIGPLGKIRQ